jgi:mRNA interferase MazF
MRPRRFEVWLADLNPRIGTESGKTRPVVIVQTDLLNEIHPSTVVCPVTTKVNADLNILRVHIRKGGLDKPSDVMVDQLRAIDNRRLLTRVGALTKEQAEALASNLKIVLDLQSP